MGEYQVTVSKVIIVEAGNALEAGCRAVQIETRDGYFLRIKRPVSAEVVGYPQEVGQK